MFDLASLVKSAGYLGVTAIVFAENGLLIGFFLPGDSLLFTAGFLASQGFFDITLLTVLLFVASVVGVGVGYWFGKYTGPKLFRRPDSRFFKHENLEKAQAFYHKHGGKTIILARFIPIVRTFAPIVAGIANMHYGKFMVYNVVGGAVWAIGLTLGGYWLGTKVENVDRYLLPIIAVIILLSVLPGIVHMLKTPERRHTVWDSVKRFFARRP
ncbi:MAG: VTT domain-containing protein [Candidatus Kerfeldbacteria bacterium]|nr:VTT domain-containing protein [Candidatus Kerfeldbacteria bacterium]